MFTYSAYTGGFSFEGSASFFECLPTNGEHEGSISSENLFLSTGGRFHGSTIDEIRGDGGVMPASKSETVLQSPQAMLSNHVRRFKK